MTTCFRDTGVVSRLRSGSDWQGWKQSSLIHEEYDLVMSSAAESKASASDKVEVSFATDDEEETSSEEDETTSSSDEEKSDGDGDADDESDMPTFTLSLQPSTGASDADDPLPDLSRPPVSSSKQESQQETVMEKTGSASETETTTEVTTFQLTLSSSTVDDEVSDTAKETPSKLLLPAAEEVEDEKLSEEKAEESEESEEDLECEKEEKTDKEENLPSSSAAATSPAPVSTKIDAKEDSTITSSKVSATESEISVKEVTKEETAAAEVMETKTTVSLDKTAKKNESSVTEVKNTHTSATKAEEKSSTEETFVAEQTADVKIDHNTTDVSKSEAAKAVKSKTSNDAEVAASTSLIPKPVSQLSKKNIKESTSKEAKLEGKEAKFEGKEAKLEGKEAKLEGKEAKLEGKEAKLESKEAKLEGKEAKLKGKEAKLEGKEAKLEGKEAKLEGKKADAVDSISPSTHAVKVTELKHEEGAQETKKSTEEKATTLLATETTVTAKLSKKSESEQSSELKTKEQSETVDSGKSSKTRKTKVDEKEIKQEVGETAKAEEQTMSVSVVTEQTTDKLESEKVETSKAITDINAKPKLNTEKTKEAQKFDESVSVSTATPGETTDKVKSEELVKDVTGTSQPTITNAVEVAVNESAAVEVGKEKALDTKMPEGKLSSKKKSKDSTADDKDSELKSVAVDSPAAASDESVKVSETNVAVKSTDAPSTTAATETIASKSSIAVAEAELEVKVSATKPNKDKPLPETNFSDKVKDKDTKVNGVEDEGKLPAGDEEEFRPRRNSIDDFIKRILAEAREEQKKILDSCAAPSGAESTSESSTSVNTKASDGLPSLKGTETEQQQQQQQQPIVNGLDVGSSTRPTRRNLEDVDIDSELADISRYYAKRTLLDRIATNDDEAAEPGSAAKADHSAKIVANGDDRLPPTSNDEVLHFVPQRRESTASVVRESSRPVRVLVDQQASVIRQLTETSRAIDELDNEVRHLRQSTGGREALYASIGAAIRDELRIYELELMSAGERLGQQKLPGGGRFIREQFVAQCAADLLQRSAATNGPRLDRAASVDEWTRGGRRRSGSFSAAVDEDAGGGLRMPARPMIPTTMDRDTTDLMIQYRHSRSGSVVSDRGYSSFDTVDEPRGTTSSILSRLTAFNGSTTATEPDFGRYSRASSEAPRLSYPRSQTISDDWTPNSSSYSVGRQYVGYSSFDSTEDTSGESDIGYSRLSMARPAGQHMYRLHQQSSIDATTGPPSRLHVRRGSLQGYSSYDSGTGNDAGRSFNSRFLSRVREKKALGETPTSRQTSGDRPFRSRFLKSSSVSGSTSTTYTSSRSAGQYESDDN